ncbi:MAG TPA: type II secretion system F family protein, partial [Bacillota bacterium]|nr:type II secretion system F family protein [Bacillota bacterium]
LNAASEFAGNMMTLLSSGLPVTKALSITGKVMSNYVVGKSVAGTVFDIEEGKRLGDVLRDNPYLPPLLTEMTAVGEESGSLEETLRIIGAYFDSEVEEKTTKAISMLEPMMTVFLGVVIGFIVIALYLPMFTMYSGM